MDLSDLLQDISKLAYEIEYEKNLVFALNVLGLNIEEAKNFSRKAVNDQIMIDEMNFNRKVKEQSTKKDVETILLARARQQTNQALETPATTSTGMELQQELANLFQNLSLL